MIARKTSGIWINTLLKLLPFIIFLSGMIGWGYVINYRVSANEILDAKQEEQIQDMKEVLMLIKTDVAVIRSKVEESK